MKSGISREKLLNGLCFARMPTSIHLTPAFRHIHRCWSAWAKSWGRATRSSPRSGS